MYNIHICFYYYTGINRSVKDLKGSCYCNVRALQPFLFEVEVMGMAAIEVGHALCPMLCFRKKCWWRIMCYTKLYYVHANTVLYSEALTRAVLQES